MEKKKQYIRIISKKRIIRNEDQLLGCASNLIRINPQMVWNPILFYFNNILCIFFL